MKLVRLLVLVILGTAALSAAAQSTAPVVLYHGFVTNTRGDPVTGSYTLKFSLFDAATAGNMRWTETVMTTVDNGNLAAQLGKTNPLTSDLFAGPPLFLEVAIGSDVFPTRQLVGAAPLALLATDTTRVAGLPVTTASCAAGQVLTYTANGWVCSALPTGTTYLAGTGLQLNGSTFSLLGTCGPGQLLKWDGSQWGCANDDTGQAYSAAAGGGLAQNGTAFGLISSCAPGQLLKWDGTAWACATDAVGPTYTAGTGIQINGTTISLITGSCSGGQVLKYNGSAWSCGDIAIYSADPDGGLVVSSNNFSVMPCSDGQFLKYVAGQGWTCGGVTGANGGTVTQVSTGSGLTGGPITTAGTIGIVPCSSANQVLRWNGSAWVCAVAAAPGANADITSLSALSTPLSIEQGGTGSATKSFCDLSSDQAIAGQKIFAPQSDEPGVVVRQSAAGAPTADIFDVESNTGASTYFWVDSSGATHWTGTAYGDISGSAGSAASVSASGISGTVGVANGGTGTSSTLSGVVLGGNPMSSVATSTAGQVLRRNTTNTGYEFVSTSGGGDPVGASRSISTGSTLQGGGDLSANRTLDINLGNANSWTNGQTIAPAAANNVASLVVKQTAAGSPSSSIFSVQNSTGASKYLNVDNTGAVSWIGTASGNISGSAGSINGILPIGQGGTNVGAVGGAGAVCYSDGSRYQFNTAGTAGQFLVSNGTSAPSFVGSVSGAGTGGTGVLGLTATGSNGVGLYATSSGGNNDIAVQAVSSSTAGNGVYGLANAAGTTGAGVVAETNATGNGSSGLYAKANRGDGGQVYGVRAETSSSAGYAVYASNTATVGGAAGVYSQTSSPTGYGVYGNAVATGAGSAAGVEGISQCASGAGVYGQATDVSGGTSYGVFGTAASTGGHGVHGEAPSYGVYGKLTGQAGAAGWFETVSSAQGAFGVYGRYNGSNNSGVGVYGLVTSVGTGVAGSGNPGVQGQTSSSPGYAVYGIASASVGTNYGVYGTTNSSAGYGLYTPNNAGVEGTLYLTSNQSLTAVGGTDTNLRIVRGGLLGSVSGCAINNGTGYTCTRNSVGNYTITYSTAFSNGSATPAPVVTPAQVGGTGCGDMRIFAQISTYSNTAFTVEIFCGGTSSGNADANFNFISIGGR
jgi:hypothetical protein